MTDTSNERQELDELKHRLSRVEAQLDRLLSASGRHPDDSQSRSHAPATDSTKAAALGEPSVPSVEERSPVASSAAINATTPPMSAPAVSTIMGFTAAIAFVLAAVYFIKLVYDAGWLTPGLQIGVAALTGIALIVAGAQFARHDKGYAAYLPAVGVVVLYLAVFAGHLHYALFGPMFALAAVAAITLCAMWLARRFDNSIYILFAVGGVYITPILLDVLRASVLDLVIYYTAWSLLFSFASINEGRRLPYMLAMLFAIIGFDVAWRMSGAQGWTLAVIYQCVQFLIFATTTYLYSVRHRTVLSGAEAAVHGVGLFYVYGIEYFTLKEYVPTWAPWLALLSVVIVLLVYVLAMKRLSGQSRLTGSAILASGYASVVTAHIVYFELVPSAYFAWAALAAPVASALASRLIDQREARMPMYLVSGAIVTVGLLSAFGGRSLTNQALPMGWMLLFAYALVLYGGFLWMRRDLNSARTSTLLLYAGHAALLVATLRAFDSGIAISLIWAIFAVVLLLFAIRRDDPVVGKSSLLIFAASGLKVLLYDLDGGSPFARVLALIVLSVSLYMGGWLYQKISKTIQEYTGNPLIDRQINKMANLIKDGYSSDGVALKMRQDNESVYGSDEDWTSDKVDEIRASFNL